MALHEGKEAKKHEEHARKMTRRARGGAMDEKKEPEDETQDEEAEAENHEAGPKESPGRKHGGKMPERQKRKAGGRVHGEAPKHRPDKRARGGATGADLHPETAAGHMTAPSFERVGPQPMGGGGGKDRD